MSVESFKVEKGYTYHDLHVEAGQEAYAVKKGDLYFTWAYTTEDFAKIIDDKLGEGPQNDLDLANNWTNDVQLTHVSDRTEF
jgi:hypothetical protein